MKDKEKWYYYNGNCTNKDTEYKQGAVSYYLCENCGLYGIPYVVSAESKYNDDKTKSICAEWLRENNKNNQTKPYIISSDVIKTILQNINKK